MAGFFGRGFNSRRLHQFPIISPEFPPDGLNFREFRDSTLSTTEVQHEAGAPCGVSGMPDGSILPDDHGRGNVNPWCSATEVDQTAVLASLMAFPWKKYAFASTQRPNDSGSRPRM